MKNQKICISSSYVGQPFSSPFKKNIYSALSSFLKAYTNNVKAAAIIDR